MRRWKDPRTGTAHPPASGRLVRAVVAPLLDSCRLPGARLRGRRRGNDCPDPAGYSSARLADGDDMRNRQRPLLYLGGQLHEASVLFRVRSDAADERRNRLIGRRQPKVFPVAACAVQALDMCRWASERGCVQFDQWESVHIVLIFRRMMMTSSAQTNSSRSNPTVTARRTVGGEKVGKNDSNNAM